MPYHHFTPIERGQLHAMKQAGQTNAAIARALGRHRSTIGRELSRNNAETKKAYCPEQAQKRYHDRRRECLRSKRLDHLPLRSYILREGSRARSPEQLAGRLRLEFPHDGHMHVAPETIYRTIYRDEGLGRMLIPQLRQARKHRRKKGMGRHSRNTFGIPNRVPIEQRPPEVEQRARYGNWEGDIYFAHPFSSNERARNENTNGLIRQYIPKGTSFENLSQQTIDSIVYKLNNRPRKSLGVRTPCEVFMAATVALTVRIRKGWNSLLQMAGKTVTMTV